MHACAFICTHLEGPARRLRLCRSWTPRPCRSRARQRRTACGLPQSDASTTPGRACAGSLANAWLLATPARHLAALRSQPRNPSQFTEILAAGTSRCPLLPLSTSLHLLLCWSWTSIGGKSSSGDQAQLKPQNCMTERTGCFIWLMIPCQDSLPEGRHSLNWPTVSSLSNVALQHTESNQNMITGLHRDPSFHGKAHGGR